MGRLWTTTGLSVLLLFVFGTASASTIKITEKTYTNARAEGYFLSYKEIRHLTKAQQRRYLTQFEKFLAKYDNVKKLRNRRSKKSKSYGLIEVLLQKAQAERRLRVGPCLNKGILFEPLDGNGCTDKDVRNEGIYQQLNTLCQAGETHCSILLGVGNCTSKNSTRACFSSTTRNKDVVLQAFQKCDVNAQGTAESPTAEAMTVPGTSYKINCNDFVNEVNSQVRLADTYVARGGRSDVSKRWVKNIVAPFRRASTDAIAATCEYKDRLKLRIPGATEAQSNCARLNQLASQQIEFRRQWERDKSAAEPGDSVGAPSGTILVSGQWFTNTDYQATWESILRNMKSCSESGRNCNVLDAQLARQSELNRQYYRDKRAAEKARADYIRQHNDTQGAPSDAVSWPNGLVLYTYLSWPGASLGDFTELKNLGRSCVADRKAGRANNVAGGNSPSLCLAQVNNCAVGNTTVSGWFTCPQVNGSCPSQPQQCIRDKTIAVQSDRDAAVRVAADAARRGRTQNQ